MLKSSLVRASRVIPRNVARRVVVFVYHSVHPTKPGSCATPEIFERHLVWLKANCELIRLGGVLEALRDDERGVPAVAITFDDGFLDNFEHAFPLLRLHGISATFFLTSGLMEKDPAVVARIERMRGESEEDVRPMEWEQVGEMKAAGMQFGCHTHSHPNLATLGRPAVEAEIERSRAILEDRLGDRVRYFAYPFGRVKRHFTAETVKIVSEQGFECAAAVSPRGVRPSDWPFRVPRFFVTHDDTRTLADKVLGVRDFLNPLNERLPLPVARRLHPEDFDV